MGDAGYTNTATTLTDTSVNGGVAVDLQLTGSIEESIEVFSQAPDVAYNDFTDTFANRLPSGRYTGFGAPKLQCKGTFFIQEGASNKITYSLLQDFIKSGNAKTLVDDLFGTIKVLISNVRVIKNNTGNGVAEYRITFIRVKDD